MPYRIWRDKTCPTALNVASPFKGGAWRAIRRLKKKDKEALCAHLELF